MPGSRRRLKGTGSMAGPRDRLRSQGMIGYFETAGHAGTAIEISDVSGCKGRFFDRVRPAAADRDGSDPVGLIG